MEILEDVWVAASPVFVAVFVGAWGGCEGGAYLGSRDGVGGDEFAAVVGVVFECLIFALYALWRVSCLRVIIRSDFTARRASRAPLS